MKQKKPSACDVRDAMGHAMKCPWLSEPLPVHNLRPTVTAAVRNQYTGGHPPH